MKRRVVPFTLGLLLTLFFSGSVFFTVQKFNEIKNQYKSIEPNLDNYSTAEILFLAFERTRTSVYQTESPDNFVTKKSVFDSKVRILKNKSLRINSFYYEPDFLSALELLEKQSDELSRLNEETTDPIRKDVLLQQMNKMQPTLINLQEIIYKIQIRNFNTIKSLIIDNSSYTELAALSCIFLLFILIILLWVHIARLNTAIRDKNIFISAIYHELSGSIQKIQLSSDMIDVRGDILNSEKYLAKITYHSNKLYLQTKEILEFSKIEIGNVGLSNVSFYTEDALNAGLSLYNESNANKIECSVYPENILVNADKQKIISIIHNIIDNANKNTHSGLIRVKLRITNSHLFLRVSDTGCGFDTKKIHLLFKPFNQGVENETRQGLGLGLSIVNSYLKTMKGRISAHSEIGKGSTFMVRIPINIVN
ncbi:sensor histidine kinase KdpD [Pantoea sp. EKM20T]|uniref:sensor histidine kinase n=1 Tax=Pantoea sp. EKM20T TaxID=2708059 RepID=UPI00142D2F9A|nr:HAMP domain-containing sensor histidine kinase [Pantoea sp. EKM20T]KAF6677070.1 HAMP domain-containing histidine kinase [Pantoea sp. EKM20T]